MKSRKFQILCALAIGLFMFGCQSDNVSPKADNQGPTLLADAEDPHPLPTNICSGIVTYPLMDETGGTIVNYCGPITCPPGAPLPAWGSVDVLNSPDNMYLNMTLTPGWFVSRCDYMAGDANNVTLTAGIPVLTTDWAAIDIDPVVNKWQLVLPHGTLPATFNMLTSIKVIKLDFFGGSDAASLTRLWIKNDDWNNTAVPAANSAAAPIHNMTPASCFPDLDYCDISFACSGYEHIAGVQIGDINNTSGNDGGYADYTDVSTHLTGGTQTTITLTPGFSGQSYTERWVVFIDWNRDGDFFDTGELVAYGAGSEAITRTIDVPANAAAGDLRMRVAMRWGCWPACPCGSYYYGEAEDYSILVDTDPNARLAPREDDNANAMAFGQEEAAPGDVELLTDATASNAGLEFRSGSDQTVNVSVLDESNNEVYTTEFAAKVGINNMNVGFPGLDKGNFKYVITGSEERAENLQVAGKE